jgi:hypothetical protein
MFFAYSRRQLLPKAAIAARALRSVRKDSVVAVLRGGLDGTSTRAGHIRARIHTVRKLRSPAFRYEGGRYESPALRCRLWGGAQESSLRRERRIKGLHRGNTWRAPEFRARDGLSNGRFVATDELQEKELKFLGWKGRKTAERFYGRRLMRCSGYGRSGRKRSKLNLAEF